MLTNAIRSLLGLKKGRTQSHQAAHRKNRHFSIETLERRDNPTALAVVTNTSARPASATVQLTMIYDMNNNSRYDNADSVYIGSGAMIGRNHVLTCGHNLFDNDPSTREQGFPKWVIAMPGRNGNQAPFGQALAVGMTVPQAWAQGNTISDIGIIRLNQNLGDRTGSFSYWAAPNYVVGRSPLAILQYPGDSRYGFNGTRQYVSTGYAAAYNDRVIGYRHDVMATFKGSSGSPLFLPRVNVGGTNYYNVITGVHVRGQNGQGGYLNQSTRITPAYQTMISSALRYDGYTSSIQSQQLQMARLGASQSYATASGSQSAAASFVSTETTCADPMLVAAATTPSESVATPKLDTGAARVPIASTPSQQSTLPATIVLARPAASQLVRHDSNQNADWSSSADAFFSSLDDAKLPATASLI